MRLFVKGFGAEIEWNGGIATKRGTKREGKRKWGNAKAEIAWGVTVNGANYFGNRRRTQKDAEGKWGGRMIFGQLGSESIDYG